MTTYVRPSKESYVPWPPPGNAKRQFWHLQDIRYVSKPLGKQVCPTRSRIGSNRVTAMGTNGWSTVGIWAENALGGLNESRVLSGSSQIFGLDLPTIATNKVYDRFRSAVLGDVSELGVNLAERKQAVDMVVDRCRTLKQSYGILRYTPRKWRTALRLLNVSPLKKHERWVAPRNASAFWLEYHFGWSPLISDIYTAIQVLESGYGKPRPVKASATARGSATRVNVGYDQYIDNAACSYSMKCGALVTITNPQLHLASKLGLINPASVAWELIPFSFLVDWFIPVGTFLNSWTDFVGLEFSNPYTTVFARASSDVAYNWQYAPASGITTHCENLWFQRSLGLPKPVVYPKVTKGLSVARGATAVALLLQVLKPGGRG